VKQALAATQCIEDNDRRVDVLNNVASALAHTTTQGDAFVGSWVTEVFAKARARGRDEVLAHIAAFSPVLAKLGVIRETWDHLQAVETLLFGGGAIHE
jgi:hypothetical protein